MDNVPLFLYLLMFGAVCYLCFAAGRGSVQYPSEDEMIRRIKELRYARKMKQEADAEVEELLKR